MICCAESSNLISIISMHSSLNNIEFIITHGLTIIIIIVIILIYIELY